MFTETCNEAIILQLCMKRRQFWNSRHTTWYWRPHNWQTINTDSKFSNLVTRVSRCGLGNVTRAILADNLSGLYIVQLSLRISIFDGTVRYVFWCREVLGFRNHSSTLIISHIININIKKTLKCYMETLWYILSDTLHTEVNQFVWSRPFLRKI